MSEFFIKNVKCGGCAANITKTLSEKGFGDVAVFPENGKLTLELNGKSEDNLKEVLHKMGYPMSDEKFGIFTEGAMKAKSFVSCAIGKTIKND